MPYILAVVIIFETVFFVVQGTKREKKHDAEISRLKKAWRSDVEFLIDEGLKED